MAINCNVLATTAVVLAVISLIINYYRLVMQWRQTQPPERTPEFLKVDTATPSEQRRFDLLQFKRDTITAARDEIISALGYPSTDESQIFAILMKYAEQLERGIIKLNKGD